MDAIDRGALQTVVNVLQRTSGRDKIARMIQYGGLFLAWLIERYRPSPTLYSLFVRPVVNSFIRRGFMMSDGIRYMSASAANARKVFRLFGFIEQLRSAASVLSLIDANKKILIGLAKLCSAGFLFSDNVVWARNVKIISVNVETWKRREYKFWLAQLTLNSLRDLYEWCLIAMREYGRANAARTGDVIPLDAQPLNTRISIICSLNRDLILDTVTNLLDLTIPLTKLGHAHIPEHIIGLIGLVTSVSRLISIVSPAYKLPYS